jgi:hypothetical protein
MRYIHSKFLCRGGTARRRGSAFPVASRPMPISAWPQRLLAAAGGIRYRRGNSGRFRFRRSIPSGPRVRFNRPSMLEDKSPARVSPFGARELLNRFERTA